VKAKALGDALAKLDKSGYAALGWSVVSFGLQIAVNAKEARGFAISSAEVVKELVERYSEYERSFREHSGEGLDRRMTDVYKAILLYVLALSGHLQQSKAGVSP
jgi:hypothetical protein